MVSFTKKPLRKTIPRFFAKLKNPFRRKRNIWAAPPIGTDWTGYETLIDFIRSSGILSVEGDMVEIGTFLGGGAYKLSRLLEGTGSSKKLYVLDVFDPNFDWTTNTCGDTMKTLYLNALKNYGGKSQLEIFLEVTKECKNIIVLRDDSKDVKIPTESICFGFVDGNHAPEYVENDFYLIWSKLTPKGAVAFHDYEGDLPEVTAKITELVNRHSLEIQKTHHDKDKNILFIIKKRQHT